MAASPGKSCKTKNSTATIKAVKYVCTQTNGRLIWKKKTNKESGSLQIPAAPTNFSNLIENYRGISYAAWNKSRIEINKSGQTATKPNLHLGPNSVLTYKTQTKAFDLISKLYDGYLQPKQLDVIAFNFSDRDWAVTQISTLLPSADSTWVKNSGCSSETTCWGGLSHSDNSQHNLIAIALGNLDWNHITGTLEAHEYTHAIQQSEGNSKGSVSWPPTWFSEGQAEFSQNAALFHTSFADYSYYRAKVTEELYRDSLIYDVKYLSEYFQIRPNSTWYTQYPGWRQYDLGSMFVEILVALKGPESTMEMWKLASAGVGFAAAFEEIYEIKFDVALPTIAEAISLQLRNK